MSRVETTVLFVYAIAALESLLRVRRRMSVPGEENETPERSPLRRSLALALRPLLPSYRFFDGIGARLEVRLVPVDDSGAPPLVLDDHPRRLLWSLFENGRENLWLHTEGLVAALVEAPPRALKAPPADEHSPASVGTGFRGSHGAAQPEAPSEDPRRVALVERARAFLEKRTERACLYRLEVHDESGLVADLGPFEWAPRGSVR